jgi:DNA-binding response OmpR family regulator
MKVSEVKEATILVVDDIRIIRRLVKVNLELEGYTVNEAENGEEAVRMIREDKPDLVLLDVVMPFLDGFQVLKRIREEDDTRNIPVIMLTSCAEEANQIKGWEMGISDFVAKPFNPNALVNVVNRVLRESDSDRVSEKRSKEIAKLKMVKTIKEADKSIL